MKVENIVFELQENLFFCITSELLYPIFTEVQDNVRLDTAGLYRWPLRQTRTL